MKGPRPQKSHLTRVWDDAQDIGRTDVTDVIETAIDEIQPQTRLYPDLYAHKITAALIAAGFIERNTA